MAQVPASAFKGELLELAGELYDSIGDSSLLAEALCQLNSLLDGAVTQLISRTEHGTVLQCVVVADGEEISSKPYATHWVAGDPRWELLRNAPAGSVLRPHAGDDEFAETNGFYRQWMLPLGLRWTLVGRFRVGNVETVLAVSRAPGAPAFDDTTAHSMRLLLPHFERACALRLEFDGLRQAADSGRNSIMQLATPCVLTDDAGRCIELNEAFGRSSRVLGISRVVGRLRFGDPETHERFEAVLMQTHATALRHDMAFIGADGTAWTVHLIPWHMVEVRTRLPVKGMILAVFDADVVTRRPSPPVEFHGASRLTQAENEVLSGMLRGLTAKAIAIERNSSYNTVRAQIVSILEKTGFSSQKELMAHLGNSTWSESTFGAPSSVARATEK